MYVLRLRHRRFNFREEHECQPEPDGCHLRYLFATALHNLSLWPSQLHKALKESNLIGRGLLICAIDARSAQPTDVQLQVPITIEPAVAGLCRRLHQNQSAMKCTEDFRTGLPRNIGSAFQFVPTDIWKGQLEQQAIGFRIARQTLKATNAMSILVWFVLASTATRKAGNPSDIIVLELCLATPGATLPGKVVAAMSTEEKVAIWEKLSRDQFTLDEYLDLRLRLCGLEPEYLRELPSYCQFRAALALHATTWSSQQETQKALLMKAWCLSAECTSKADKDLRRRLSSFFQENRDTIKQLREIMGSERRVDTMRSAMAHLKERANRKAHYITNFGNRLAHPCPVCGKPLTNVNSYTCDCQQPAKLQPSQAPSQPAMVHHNQTPSTVPDTHTASCRRYRRKKNIQTGFTHKPTQSKECAANAHSHSGTTPAAPQEPAAVSVGKHRRANVKVQETDSVMARLREQVQWHRATDLISGEDLASSACATVSSQARSRKSRRSAPQGDSKLARKLAADEILFHKPDQPTPDADEA